MKNNNVYSSKNSTQKLSNAVKGESSVQKVYKVVLIVDHPLRDLPGMVLVAMALAQKQIVVYLVPANLRNVEIWSLVPDLVVLNYIRKNNEKLAQQLLDAGIKVVVLDTEGGVFSPVPSNYLVDEPCGVSQSNAKGVVLPTYEEYGLIVSKNDEVRHKLSAFLAWTPDLADYALQRGWFCNNQVRVTGTPRSDFYNSRFQPALKALSRTPQSYDDPLILIIGGFSLSHPRFVSPEQEVEQFFTNNCYSREAALKLQQVEIVAFDGLAETINNLAEAFPSITFIYRPHPFEESEVMATRTNGFPNVHVDCRETVDSWLLKAKAVIHWRSSVAIEASFVDVPVFIPGWLPRTLSVPEAEAVSEFSVDIEGMIESLTGVIDGSHRMSREIASSIEESIFKTYYKIDGEAHRRVADVIEELLVSERGCDIRRHCKKHAYVFGNDLSFIHRAYAAMRRVLGVSVHWKFVEWKERVQTQLPWDLTDKVYTVEDVQRVVDAVVSFVGVDAVRVSSASESGAYQFGYKHGRAVCVQA